MGERVLNKWVVVLALLVTLLLWLLALGVADDGVVLAGNLNQTIPTLTPSGVPTDPPTEEPTVPPPTRPPGEPSDTAAPVPTGSPSPVLTSLPTGTAVPATATDASTATAAPEATSTPPVGSGTPLPTEPATLTPTPPAASSAALTSVAPSASPTSGAPPSGQEGGTQEPTPLKPIVRRTPSPVASSTAREGTTFFNTSCLWLGAGLLLIVVGIVLLVRWRRSG